jgi:anti-anti-sigma factor
VRRLCEVLDASSESEAVLAITGEFDAACAELFADAARAMLAKPDLHGAMAVDMSGVGFMDSAGLAAVLAAYNAAQRQGVRLYVREPTAHAQRVLDTAGVADLLGR